MSNDTVETLIKLAEQHARNVLFVLRRDLMPSWVIIDKDGQPHIHGTPWRNDLEKELTRIFIGRELRKYQAHAYSFVTEAWTAQGPADWDPETPLPKKDRPMHRADRQEIVLAFASDGQKQVCRRWLIRRDWNEQIIALELVPGDDSYEMQGWMTELLPQKSLQK